jgi:hypothetical protein
MAATNNDLDDPQSPPQFKEVDWVCVHLLFNAIKDGVLRSKAMVGLLLIV